MTDPNLIGENNDELRKFAWTVIFIMNIVLVVWLPIGGYIGINKVVIHLIINYFSN